MVARAAAIDAPLAAVPARSASYYAGLRGGFRLDLHWRAELGAETLHVFEERAEAHNTPYRYDGGAR